MINALWVGKTLLVVPRWKLSECLCIRLSRIL